MTSGVAKPTGRDTTKVLDIEASTTVGQHWSEEATDFVTFHGVRIKWRPRGERLWRKVTVIPQDDQTVDSLLRDAPDIAQACYRREALALLADGNPDT